jgi:hypothetical protein
MGILCCDLRMCDAACRLLNQELALSQVFPEALA